MVRFSIDRNGEWKVIKLVTDHNHELVRPKHRHLMHSMRSISEAQGNIISSMVNAGISTKKVWSDMGEETSGTQELGFSKKRLF